MLVAVRVLRVQVVVGVNDDRVAVGVADIVGVVEVVGELVAVREGVSETLGVLVVVTVPLSVGVNETLFEGDGVAVSEKVGVGVVVPVIVWLVLAPMARPDIRAHHRACGPVRQRYMGGDSSTPGH